MKTADLLVIGLGGVGSAALMHAAKSGLRAIGIEQFTAAHDRGSSHGETRVIRQAYFEHSDYVPLLQRAYQLWDQLQSTTAQQIFRRSELLEIGPAHGLLIPGVLKSARQHNLSVELLDHAACRQRFPQFHLPDNLQAVVEGDAGILFVERCILAHLAQAEQFGATIRLQESLKAFSATANGLRVTTDREQYSVGALVIAAGAWAGHILNLANIPLAVWRKHLHWFQTDAKCYSVQQQRPSPLFFYETDAGLYYGFPELDQQGVKIAEHSGGEPIAGPADVDRGIDRAELERVESFARNYLPQLQGRHRQHCTCLYTMTSDEHFIVDFHPESQRIALAAGLSGHGFKFTAVLGELLIGMLKTGSRPESLDFLSLGRFSR
jgi:monomeric sarcosine oxidase